MHKLLQYIVKFNFYWLIYFFVLRLFFLAFNFSYVDSDSFLKLSKFSIKGLD